MFSSFLYSISKRLLRTNEEWYSTPRFEHHGINTTQVAMRDVASSVSHSSSSCSNSPACFFSSNASSLKPSSSLYDSTNCCSRLDIWSLKAWSSLPFSSKTFCACADGLTSNDSLLARVVSSTTSWYMTSYGISHVKFYHTEAPSIAFQSGFIVLVPMQGQYFLYFS